MRPAERTAAPLIDRRLDAGGLLLALLLMTGCLAAALRAGASPDTWRDLYFAEAIASGREFPAIGPIIGGIGHLGPMWYYLLAIGYAAAGSQGVLTLIGLLVGSKFPLAWWLGRRVVDRRLGALLVVALMLPGWPMFELLWPTHTSVVVTALLALASAALACRRAPGPARAALVGLLTSVAVHAHPTTLLLAGMAVLWSLAGALPWRRRAQMLAATIAAAMLPWLPLLLTLATVGHDDLQQLGRYAGNDLQWPSASAAIELLTGLLWRGPALVERLWLFAPMTASLLLSLHALGLLLATVGLLWLLRGGDRRARRLLAGLLALLLAQTAFVLLLRPITPFWMAYAHVPLLAALLALGWRALLRRPALAGAVAVAALGLLLPFAALLRFVAAPPDPVAFPTFAPGSPGMMSVRSTAIGQQLVGNPQLPAPALERIAPRLCRPTVVYGHLAALVDLGLGLGIRPACGSVDQVAIGGPWSVGQQALLGLTASAARAAGWPPSDAAIEVRPVRAVWTHGRALPVVGGGTFPWRDLSGTTTGSATIDGVAGTDQLVVVATRADNFVPFTVDAVRVDGQPLKPLYADRYLSLYRCSDCEAASRWRIAVTGATELVDVLTVDAP